MTTPRARSERLCFALAAIAYLLTALFILGNVLPEPSRLLPYNSGIDPLNRQVGHFDQSMVVSTITRNAHVLLTEPWNLLGEGQCYPFPKSFTLGEHMFGEGFQMALPWLLTGDPILAYNLMLVLTLWLPGVTMYVLAKHFTRHAGAAFVSGLVLQLTPGRIVDGGHPYLHAEFWLPLILLFLHKLFTTERRWTAAIGIGLFLALEGLETIYVLLGCSAIAGVYGLHLALRNPSRIPRVILPLGAALAFAMSVVWLALSPYFETRATWDVLSGRGTVLFTLDMYAPGTPYFIGVLVGALVLLGLIDRARGRREVDGEDPRLAVVLAGCLVFWATLSDTQVPGTNLQIPGLLALLHRTVPGLDALRGLFAVTVGLWVPTALVAGYGALLLFERLRPAVMIVLVAMIAFALMAERYWRPVALWSFGAELDLAAWDARPPEDDIELIRKASLGPVADVPMSDPSNPVDGMTLSRNLLLQSWKPVPSSSCYNSFDTPLREQIFQLSDALPNTGAAEALAAVGFTTVLSHTHAWWKPHWRRWQRRLELDPGIREVMPEFAQSTGLTSYRLEPRAPIRDDITMLSGIAQGPPVELKHPAHQPDVLVVPFVFRNPGPETFRLPTPHVPRDAVLRWTAHDGEEGVAESVRVLWPIALGAEMIMRIDVKSYGAPPPGRYHVQLSAAETRDHVLATRDVIVPPPPGTEDAE